MTKYQLERIKDMYSGISDPDRLDGIPVVTVAQSDIDWLIEQAERVQELEQQNKNYRKAIKECVERMNEGGAGTRSFVYEKLIEVLEGEE